MPLKEGLTDGQAMMLRALAQTSGSLRPKGKDNFVVRSLERRGYLSRSEYNDCRITNEGRSAYAAFVVASGIAN